MRLEPKYEGQTGRTTKAFDVVGTQQSDKPSDKPSESVLDQHRAKIMAEPQKGMPLYSGCIAYFYDALMAVAELSQIANDKHNPGKPLGWSKGHSNAHLDSAGRHLGKAGTWDLPESSGLSKPVRHSTELAWRALANLQTEIENERERLRITD